MKGLEISQRIYYIVEIELEILKRFISILLKRYSPVQDSFKVGFPPDHKILVRTHQRKIRNCKFYCTKRLSDCYKSVLYTISYFFPLIHLP